MAQYTKPYGDFNVFSKKLQQGDRQATVFAALPPKDNAATDRQFNVEEIASLRQKPEFAYLSDLQYKNIYSFYQKTICR